MQVKFWKPELSNISEKAIIGDDTIVHSQVWIGDGVKIGERCKIQAFVFIPTGVEIGDDVFIGPGVKFSNDVIPPSCGKYWKKILVKEGAVIGMNSSILAGITIGKNAFIGQHSNIITDIPDNEVWFGNPAKFYKMRNDL